MTTAAQEPHLPALDEHRRREIGGELQATLVELIDLSLIGKQLHWNIFGRPPFKPLHEHLDELVDAWRDLSDTVAERAVALGLAPDGQAGAVIAESRIEPERAGREHPLVKGLTVLAERFLLSLLGPGGVAVERHRLRELDLPHLCTPWSPSEVRRPLGTEIIARTRVASAADTACTRRPGP